MRRLLTRAAGALRVLLWRRQAEQELDEELRAYVDAAIDRHIAAGMSAADARRLVRVETGSLEAVKERVRDVGWESLALSLVQDVRYAARMLMRSPGFTAAALLTLALGIGATTAIYSVVHAIVLRSLPYRDADRIVRISEEVSSGASEGSAVRPVGLSKEQMEALRASSWTLSHIGSYLPASMTLSARDGAVRIEGIQLSPPLMTMFGLAPAHGRVFERREENPLDRVIILSHGAWQRRFGGDPRIIGAVLQLDGSGYEVIGVMPQGFFFPNREAEFWIPLAFPRGARLVMTARVKDGVSIEAARQETAALLARLRTSSPYPPPPPPAGRRRTLEEVMAQPPAHIAGPAERGPATRAPPPDPPRVRLVPLHEHVVGSSGKALLFLMTAGLCVLLIACANLANLLMARNTARRREIATRLALGAGRRRLMRQLLTESLVLASLGGATGIALAVLGVRLLHQLGAAVPHQGFGPSTGLPRLDEVGVDGGVLVFALAATVLSGLAAGLWPALHHTRGNVTGEPLRDGVNTPAGSLLRLRGRRSGGALVTTQICLATVLLVCGTLLARGFVRLSSVDPGYDTQNVLTFHVTLPHGAATGSLRDELLARLAELPRVQAATFADYLPMTGGGSVVHLRRTPAIPVGPPPPPLPGGSMRPEFPTLRVVGHDYLKVLGIEVLEGRGFSSEHRVGQPAEALISRSLARSGYLGDQPVGLQVYLTTPAPIEVVGIVDDLHLFNLDQAPGPLLFVKAGEMPAREARGGTMPGLRGGAVLPAFMLRTEGDAASVGDSVRAVVRELHPGATVERMATLEEIVSNTLVRPRVYTVFLIIFSAIAAAVAIIGIYGLIAYAVRQRVREIGVRIALGASRHDIFALIAANGMLLACAGILAGLAGAAAASRYLAGLLYGISPLDPGTYATVAVVFAVVALAACWVPARWAARVDPAITLRCE